MDFSKISEYVGRVSVATLLASILIAQQMGYWVDGQTHRQMVAERDEWKSIALKATHLASNEGPHVTGMMPPTVSPNQVMDKLEQIEKDKN